MKPSATSARAIAIAIACGCAGWLLPLTTAWSAAEPAAAPPPATARVLIAYDTLTGHTEKMAEGVAEGVRRAPGVEVVMKRVEAVTRDDLQAADGIILGCPTYFGTPPGRMKALLDDWSWKLKVDFTDKVGGAFATGGGQTGGKEFTVLSLVMFMLNNRMIVAGPLYQNPTTGSVWGEVGASAITGPLDPGIGENELDHARRLGERIARLARKLKATAASAESAPQPH